MLTLQNYTPKNTKGIAGLSNQLCHEAVKMGFLAKIKSDKVECDSDSLVHLFLHPDAVAALEQLADCLQESKIVVSTCYRTLAQQYVLKRNLSTVVANVGRSDHGSGKGLDITNYAEYPKLLNKHDFYQTYGDRDPVHWDKSEIPDNRIQTVIAFQQLWNRNNDWKIDVDGSVGQNTLRALANSPANGFINAEVPRILSMTDKGKDVGRMQSILIQAKLYTGAFDGIFGHGMLQAVIDFQTKYKLPVTGIIDNWTRGRLLDYPDLEIPA
jgi:N-acetylmuramoyl-L-alanine amidase